MENSVVPRVVYVITHCSLFGNLFMDALMCLITPMG